MHEHIIRGQYVASEKKKRDIVKKKDVDPLSRTETYVAMKLGISNWRWNRCTILYSYRKADAN